MNQEELWLLNEKYGGEKCEAFFTDLELLKSGTPLAYLIGSIPFLKCTIYLDSHPLIPRTETEFWTEKAIQKIRDTIPYSPELGIVSLRILDLCAGSGAIGVSVANAIPNAQVDFVEIDPTHLPTIKKNIEKNTIIYDSEKYTILENDLFKNIPQTNKYHFILTNPPYIDPVLNRTEQSVKLHEPSLALYGGNDGMECIQQIITQAPTHLYTNGQLWIEHEPEQTAAIAQLAQQHGWLCSTHKDQYNTERYSILVLQ